MGGWAGRLPTCVAQGPGNTCILYEGLISPSESVTYRAEKTLHWQSDWRSNRLDCRAKTSGKTFTHQWLSPQAGPGSMNNVPPDI